MLFPTYLLSLSGRRARHSLPFGLAAIAATSALATLPAAASADSIAYIKDGDVWLATSDGNRQFRVTARGGYGDVTQADDGTLVALRGVRLHRLSRSGAVLADFDTPVSDTRPEGQRVFYGPFDPAISPNGSRLAYTYYYVGKGTAPGCYPPSCMTTVTEGGTGYSHADRQTAWDEPGLGRHSGWRNASWIDDATTMISDPTHVPNADVLLDVVGDQGVPIMDWFSDTGTPHLGGGEMTRQRTKLAFQAGEGDTAIRLYRMPGNYPALPEACYGYGGATGTVGTPSWSPDGARLAWADGAGIKVVDVPSFAAGCTTDGASPETQLLVAGGAQPDWGPANVPAGSGAAPGGNGSGGQDGGGGQAGGIGNGNDGVNPTPPVPDAPLKLAGALRLWTLDARLSKGVRVGIGVDAPGRITAKVTARGRTVASRSPLTMRAAGRRDFTLRISNSGKRTLRQARGRARLQLTFTPKRGGKRRTISTAITVQGAGR